MQALTMSRDPYSWRFALPWALPVLVGLAALDSPWRALTGVVVFQGLMLLLERVPRLQRSPGACAPSAWHRACLRFHVPLQAALLGVGCAVALALPVSPAGVADMLALGLAVGWITGSQGITIAHELGHRSGRLDRLLAWSLMASVLYAHFMIEHYRGHHRLAATTQDPATARCGESLWRFLPRTVAGSWRSAWALERQHLARRNRGWARSPLAWAVALQGLGLAGLAMASPMLAVFWCAQSAMAVFLLEVVNYIEHYGLQRARNGERMEPFGMHHAWNADHLLTNGLLVNLPRHSDHHLNAWKPFESLQALPGPQLPSGYAGCVVLAMVPPLWFRLMHPRLARAQAAQASNLASGVRP